MNTWLKLFGWRVTYRVLDSMMAKFEVVYTHPLFLYEIRIPQS